MSLTTALKARQEALRDREAGFTLIELLVVVIIIGILAAIAIPIYIGVQNNAKDAAVKSDLTNAKTAIVAWQTDNPNLSTLPALTVAALGANGFTLSQTYSAADTPTYAGTPTQTAWCINAKSSTTKPFNISSTGAVASGVCS